MRDVRALIRQLLPRLETKSLPIPNHSGVPKTKEFIDSLPNIDAARIVDLNTISSVNGPLLSAVIYREERTHDDIVSRVDDSPGVPSLS
jgi:hypothetical protein